MYTTVYMYIKLVRFFFTYFWTKYLMLNRLKTVKAMILWHFITITVFFFNILKNLFYAFDGKAEFFSSTWSFRKHLIIQTICAVYVNNPVFVLTLIFRCLEAASSLHRSWEADPVSELRTDPSLNQPPPHWHRGHNECSSTDLAYLTNESHL